MGMREVFYSVVTGSARRRNILTPVGFLVFLASLGVVFAGGTVLDRLLDLPRLLPGLTGDAIGWILLVPGTLLAGWCVYKFARSRGTPVPFNPPKTLIVEGIYLHMRNPMITGLFASLLGAGLLLHSTATVLIWIPLYFLLHVLELKKVEEPELAMRFGEAYAEYQRTVPMFIPRLRRRRG